MTLKETQNNWIIIKSSFQFADAIIYNNGEATSYGFNHSGSFIEVYTLRTKEKNIQSIAPKELVLNKFKLEFLKRGLKKDAIYECVISKKLVKFKGFENIIMGELDIRYVLETHNETNSVLFHNGVFAKIVDIPIDNLKEFKIRIDSILNILKTI